MDMLSQIYPVHVLEYMSSLGTDHHSPDHTAIGQLARRHEQVTILFMDIVGEPRRRAWNTLPWCLCRLPAPTSCCHQATRPCNPACRVL